MDFITPDFANPAIWISLLTLTFLEIVLGIDNVIFISIVAGKLPVEKQRRARNIGLILAMVFRIGLLLCISWIIGLKDPVFTIPAIEALTDKAIPLSYKDIILIAGGIFLIAKSTMEIHHKFQNDAKQEFKKGKKTIGFSAVIFQIVMVVVLIASGLHQVISKSIIYSCLFFSLVVEMLNIKLRKRVTIE